MPTQQNKPAETQGLYAGEFGKYYKDAELTQYVGKVVDNRWVPATPDDIQKDKESKDKSALPTTPNALTVPKLPSAPKPTAQASHRIAHLQQASLTGGLVDCDLDAEAQA